MSVVHRLIVPVIAFAIVAPAEGQKQSAASRKPTVYNFVGRGSERTGEAEIRAVYRNKFNIVDFSDERAYIRSKNTKRLIPRPIIEGGRTVKGSVRVVFVVNEEGRVIQPFVLQSTNEQLNRTVLDVITQWRGKPAMLNGAPIAILLCQDFTFK